MARLEDTEKRHNTHMVRTIRVCLYRIRVWYGKSYRTRMVCTIRVWYIPYAYGTKYAYGIEHKHLHFGPAHHYGPYCLNGIFIDINATHSDLGIVFDDQLKFHHRGGSRIHKRGGGGGANSRY